MTKEQSRSHDRVGNKQLSRYAVVPLIVVVTLSLFLLSVHVHLVLPANAFVPTDRTTTCRASVPIIHFRLSDLKLARDAKEGQQISEATIGNEIIPIDVTDSSRTRELITTFVDKIDHSIASDSFVSLTLRGIKAKKSSKQKSSDRGIEMETLRGSIRQVQGRLIRLSGSKGKNKKNDGGSVMLQLTLKYHLATDIVKNIDLDETKKTLTGLLLDPSVASEWGVQAVKSHPLRGALLATTLEAWDLNLGSKPTMKRQQSEKAHGVSSVRSHDRTKQVPLSKDATFLQLLGVTNKEGKPKLGMASKLRQCQKFVEIVSSLVEKTVTQEVPCINVLDMGCGRGYLTFSLHSHLAEKYGTSNVQTKGIDIRPKLIEEMCTISDCLDGSFERLKFETGTIQQLVEQASTSGEEYTKPSSSLDILVALHACDTATDDALYSGIARNTDVIVVAPCCHKELRSQLDSHASQIDPILKHAIYRERMSETATDSLRALLLELAGYKVQVFEFIGGEHTAKNVMITATKNVRHKGGLDDVEEQIRSLTDEYGIRTQKLAQWMGVGLVDGVEKGKKNIPKKASVGRMPPRIDL